MAERLSVNVASHAGFAIPCGSVAYLADVDGDADEWACETGFE